MKKSIFLILFIFPNLIGFSQSNIRINNFWENTYYINPASVYSYYKYVASTAGRKQWIGFPGSPSTEYVTFAARLIAGKDYNQIGQLGFKIFHDNIGFTKLFNFSPSYSRTVPINEELLMNLGIAYKIQSISYDRTRARKKDEYDKTFEEYQRKWIDHNADFGVEFVGTSFVFGAASQNFMSLFDSVNNNLTNTNFIYGFFKSHPNKYIHWLPGVCLINNKDFYQMEFKVSVLLDFKNNQNSSNKSLQFGFFYRLKEELGAFYSINFNENMSLIGSYDYNVGDISHSSFGTLEMMLIWKFRKLNTNEIVTQCSDCDVLVK